LGEVQWDGWVGEEAAGDVNHNGAWIGQGPSSSTDIGV
jgi:hypothetical protein